MAGEFDMKTLGDLLIEGKTKKIHLSKSDPSTVIVLNKDRITAGDGARAHDLEGKAEIATKTNSLVFELLNAAGVPTTFIRQASNNIFIAKKVDMVPLEWITRRLATGSYLKRHPGVHECFRFTPPKQETCFKDDANHDPLWSDEQIICANLPNIGRDEIQIMKRLSLVVFEILEKVWAQLNCVLVDMKIEFGIDDKGNVLVSDVIDSDSWRLWPEGKKELMKDKQVYRNLTNVTSESLNQVKINFRWIADTLESLKKPTNSLVVIALGSSSDLPFAANIETQLKALDVKYVVRIVSAHKQTAEALNVVAEYEGVNKSIVFIAVAGKSNGLGPVIAGNTSFPVINCPPLDSTGRDVWSSINLPAGIACTTVTSASNAALAAAQILALNDVFIWGKLRMNQTKLYTTLNKEDKKTRVTNQNYL
uniref:Multifunctional protein ADE2 n=2 Tax=Cacopsylla melanoneura TaxID=428564 RepID=A0A8D8TWX1_9HEMI